MGSGATKPQSSDDSEQAPERESPKAKLSAMQKQVDTYGYPPPAPPSDKKDKVFNISKYKEIDKYAINLPTETLYGTYEQIAAYLIKKSTTDIDKLRALFTWTTSIDVASLQAKLEELPEEGRPLDYLLKIHWKMGNIAHFFTQLCRAANMPCVIVTGCTKSAAYQLGGNIDKKTMRGQWNCVHVDGSWRFVDVYWASTCVEGKNTGDWNLVDINGDMKANEEEAKSEGDNKHKVNEGYFLPDPEKFIYTHLPDEASWQLLETPIDIATFARWVYIRERFFDTGMKLIPESYEDCIVQPKNGEVEMKFGFTDDVDIDKMQYTYKLFRSRKVGEEPPSIPYERFVFFNKKTDIASYKCRFPVTGKYKMDIFGKKEGGNDNFDLCCSYLIKCDVAMKNCQPFPDCPEDGWGTTAAASSLSVTSSEANTDPIITSKDGLVEIRLKSKTTLNIQHILQNNDIDEYELNNHAYITQEGEDVIIRMRLPQKGEYALNLFAAKEGTQGELPNIGNYFISVERDNASLKAFPKLHEGAIGKGSYADALGITPLTETSGNIRTDDAKFKLEFEHKAGIELFCAIDHTELDKELLSRSAKVTNTGTTTTVDVNLPLLGEYSINTYAKMKSEPSQLYHAHTYLVDSRQSTKGEIITSRDTTPVIPGSTFNDKAILYLTPTENTVLAELQRRQCRMPMQKDQVKGKQNSDQCMLSVKLPEPGGEYQVDVFEKTANDTLLNVSTYDLVRLEHSEEEKAAAKALNNAFAENAASEKKEKERESKLSQQQLQLKKQQEVQEAKWQAERDTLKASFASQDPTLINEAIVNFEKMRVPDGETDVKKAKELVSFLNISKELSAAMAARDLPRLEKVCEDAEKQELEKKLGLQLKMAQKVRDQLRRLERLRHAILNLDQKTIAEIKSYSKPPEGVHKVMIATFLLLGQTEKELKEWPQCVVWINKTGKEGLKRRITQDFKVEKLKLPVAKKAKSLLKAYELDVIRDLSAGAATFYVWATGMIEECEFRNS